MFNLKLLSNKAFDSIQNRFNSKDSITVCLLYTWKGLVTRIFLVSQLKKKFTNKDMKLCFNSVKV